MDCLKKKETPERTELKKIIPNNNLYLCLRFDLSRIDSANQHKNV